MTNHVIAEDEPIQQSSRIPPRVLVAGGTGVVGRAVTRLLHERGIAVRTFSRDPRRAESLRAISADSRTGDAVDPQSLGGVLDGIERVLSCLGAPVTLGADFAEIAGRQSS